MAPIYRGTFTSDDAQQPAQSQSPAVLHCTQTHRNKVLKLKVGALNKRGYFPSGLIFFYHREISHVCLPWFVKLSIEHYAAGQTFLLMGTRLHCRSPWSGMFRMIGQAQTRSRVRMKKSFSCCQTRGTFRENVCLLMAAVCISQYQASTIQTMELHLMV